MTTDLQILQTVARMPRVRRRAVLLVNVNGCTFAQAAKELGVSQKRLEKELLRAYEKLASLPCPAASLAE